MAEAYISLPTAGSGVSQMPVLSGSSSEPTSVEISMRERDSNGVQPHLSESFPHAWAGRSGVSPASQDSALERSNPNFEALKMLNRGASGFVQLARDRRTGQLFAIKYIPRGESFDVRTISRELMNQRMCSGHPNVIQLHEVFLTTDYLGIAMEYADGGDVSQFIDDQSANGMDGLPEEDARWLFQQLMVALDMIHRLGIVNRDVKLDNMMLHGSWPSPILKICDFGFSKDEAGQSTSKSTCGTPEYMAPEVLFESRYDGKAADIWSCGVSLYVMLTGVFPFARDCDDGINNVLRMQRQFTRILQGDYIQLSSNSLDCQDLMSRLLHPDPLRRITMAGVMNHPWFKANLPPPLLTLNARIMATSAHNAGIPGMGQSATEVLQLIGRGRSSRCLRSVSATSPADYQIQEPHSHVSAAATTAMLPLPNRFQSQTVQPTSEEQRQHRIAIAQTLESEGNQEQQQTERIQQQQQLLLHPQSQSHPQQQQQQRQRSQPQHKASFDSAPEHPAFAQRQLIWDLQMRAGDSQPTQQHSPAHHPAQQCNASLPALQHQHWHQPHQPYQHIQQRPTYSAASDPLALQWQDSGHQQGVFAQPGPSPGSSSRSGAAGQEPGPPLLKQTSARFLRMSL